MRQPPRIVTENLILRLAALTDARALIHYTLENEAHLTPFEPERPEGLYTEPFWEERVKRCEAEFFNDRMVQLYLFEKDDREVIGSLQFSQIARGPFQACYLGYGIARKKEGHGLMHEAAKAAIAYAFGQLNLHRIMANHLPENERSARLLTRLGFQRECVAKDYLRIGGTWRDHVLNSLTNPGWQPQVAAPSVAR